ncbi:MAG: hypothetical protein AAF574_11630, partial [Pseudomonadota bacterium]
QTAHPSLRGPEGPAAISQRLRAFQRHDNRMEIATLAAPARDDRKKGLRQLAMTKKKGCAI